MNNRELKKKQLFYALNSLLPVLGCLLLFICKNRYVWPTLVSVLSRPFAVLGADAAAFEKTMSFIFVYLRDILWSYALVFAVTFWNSKTLQEIRRGFLVTAMFELGILILERLTVMNGAFDLKHFLALLLGTSVGMGILLFRERGLREKRSRRKVHAVEVVLILFLFLAGAIAGTRENAGVKGPVTEIAEAAFPTFTEISEHK